MKLFRLKSSEILVIIATCMEITSYSVEFYENVDLLEISSKFLMKTYELHNSLLSSLS